MTYLDLRDKFLGPDGSINRKLFSDGTHLTPQGYRIWADSLKPLVSAIMKKPPLKPVRIMLIGGRITEGKNAAGACRRYLDGMLRRKGRLIDFVGSRKKHNDNQTPPAGYQYDPDHEGHWGKNSQWLAENIAGLLAGRTPDVAVINIGAEDIVSGSGDAEALTGRVVENIGKVINTLRSKNKTVKIVLANVIPARGKADEINVLNRKISGCAKANSTDQSPVVLADLHTGFKVSSDLGADGVLPNPTGAEKMAKIFADAINTVLGGGARK